jgi:ribonuclease HII
MVKIPSLDHEKTLYSQGYRLIAGIDEVGRGTIAGPVFAAAVVLPYLIEMPWLNHVRDSKQLSPKKRESLCEKLLNSEAAIGIGMASQTDVDNIGIVGATRIAMRKAIEHLPLIPDFLLIDALDLPDISLPQKSITYGDELCFSIACASIVAKVKRDHFMIELDKQHPGYGLAQHKGYATRQHLDCLHQLGPSPIHRCSFAPVRILIERELHRH